MFDYYGLSEQKVQKVFPGCLPCICNNTPNDSYKIPRYNVKIYYGDFIPKTNERKIKKICVKCGCCESTKSFNVECFEVSTSTLPW